MDQIGMNTTGYVNQVLPGDTKHLQGGPDRDNEQIPQSQGDTVALKSKAPAPAKVKGSKKKPPSPADTPGTEKSATSSSPVPAHLSMEEEAPVLSSHDEDTAAASLHQAARRASCAHLKTLQESFEKGELKDKDFSRAANELYNYAFQGGEGDPLVKTVATHLLAQYVSSASPVGQWIFHHGPVKGPSAYLTKLDNTLLNSGDRVYVGDENKIPDFVETLNRNTTEGPVPEEALKATAHLANTLYRRSAMELKEEMRAKETTEKDRAWADSMSSLVQDWWSYNQVKVVQDGKPVWPGGLDMAECLKNDRVQVHGSTIVLSTPGKKSRKADKEVAACIKELEKDYSKKKTGMEMLEQLSRTDPGKAQKVVDALVDEAAPRVDHSFNTSKLATLIENGGGAPWLKDLVRPHLTRLTTYPAEAEARNIMEHNNLVSYDISNLTKQLVALFPEHRSSDLLKGSLIPLARCDEINLQNHFHEYFEPLVKEKSMDLAPLFDDLATSDMDFMQDRQWQTLCTGLEHTDWKPSREAVEKLSARLYYPAGRDKTSIFGGTVGCQAFAKGVHFFTLLEGKDPAALKGLELPDSRGDIVPFKRALLDRVLTDPSSNLLEKLTGSFRQEAVPELYKLFSTDAGIPGELMDLVEKEFAAAQSLNKMSAPAQNALAVLGGLAPGEPVAGRLKTLLRSLRHTEQGMRDFNGILNKERTAYIDEKLPSLGSGTLAPREAVDLCRDLLVTADCKGESSYDRALCDKIGAALAKSLEPVKGGKEYPAITQELLDDLKKAASATKGLQNLSLQGFSSLQMLEYLGRDDLTLRGELKATLMPFFREGGGVGFGMEGNFLQFYGKGEMDSNVKRLAEAQISREGRLRAIDENMAMAPYGEPYSGDSVTKKLLTTLREGFTKTPAPVTADMGETLKSDANLFKAYSRIAPAEVAESGLAPYWSEFKNILVSLGGEDAIREDGKDEENARARLFGQKDMHNSSPIMNRFDTALDIYLYLKETAAQGVPREKAYAHALECRSLGMDPRSTPMKEEEAEKPPATSDIEYNDDEMVLDGIKLRINNDN
jgi:hypothetical protein